jgi:hypothetical protein
MKKPPITHLILDTSSSNENDSGDCDYCLVPMTAQYISYLLSYMDKVHGLHRADESVYSLKLWDASAVYFVCNDRLGNLRDIDGNLVADVPSGEPILLAADPQLDEADFKRIDCQSVQIISEGMCWTAYIKHTNIRVESAHIEKKTLLRILRSLGGAREPRKPARASRLHPAIQQIHDLLYLNVKGTNHFYDPDRQWDADTLDMIAEIIARYIPRPKEN